MALSHMWNNIHSYEDLLKVNVMFLRGELKETPYHLGPLEPDSIPLIDELIEMHNLRMLSVNGQGGLCIYGDYAPPFRSYNGELLGDWYYDVEQRAYVEFYIENTDFNTKFVQALTRDPNMEVQVIDLDNYRMYDNVVDEALTRGRSSNTLEELKNVPWKLETWVQHIDNPEDVLCEWGDHPNIQSILSNSYRLTVVMKSFCIGGL